MFLEDMEGQGDRTGQEDRPRGLQLRLRPRLLLQAHLRRYQLRQQARRLRLPQLWRRLRQLEERVKRPSQARVGRFGALVMYGGFSECENVDGSIFTTDLNAGCGMSW